MIPKRPAHQAFFYTNFTNESLHGFIRECSDSGARIAGENPWSIELRQNRASLTASWDEESRILTVRVTNKEAFVPDSSIWDTVHSLVKGTHQNLADNMSISS